MRWDTFAEATGLTPARGVLALAPHPDDETLGCGGLLAMAGARGVPTRVAYLTDGGASHPGSADWPPARLGALRRQEARRACHVLGVARAPVFFGLPDGGTLDAPLGDATARLADLVRRDRPGLIVTTWRLEPHCDHRAAWTVAREARAGTDARLAAFVVWSDLIGAPGDAPGPQDGRCPTSTLLALALGPALATKRRALAAHRSQLGAVVRDDPGGFVLSAPHREAMLAPTERYWL